MLVNLQLLPFSSTYIYIFPSVDIVFYHVVHFRLCFVPLTIMHLLNCVFASPLCNTPQGAFKGSINDDDDDKETRVRLEQWRS